MIIQVFKLEVAIHDEHQMTREEVQELAENFLSDIFSDERVAAIKVT